MESAAEPLQGRLFFRAAASGLEVGRDGHLHNARRLMRFRFYGVMVVGDSGIASRQDIRIRRRLGYESNTFWVERLCNDKTASGADGTTFDVPRLRPLVI